MKSKVAKSLEVGLARRLAVFADQAVADIRIRISSMGIAAVRSEQQASGLASTRKLSVPPCLDGQMVLC